MQPDQAVSAVILGFERPGLPDQDAGRGEKARRKEKERIKELEKFFLKTGWERDTEREDDFVKYTMKLIRDLLTFDQISTEIQRTRGRDI